MRKKEEQEENERVRERLTRSAREQQNECDAEQRGDLEREGSACWKTCAREIAHSAREKTERVREC